jgi:hypothetical protein
MAVVFLGHLGAKPVGLLLASVNAATRRALAATA